MNSFEFYSPTKIIFGKAAETNVGEELLKWNVKKALIHFGSKSAINSGLLNRIQQSISQNNIDFVTLGGVVPNPRLSLVREGIEICKKEKVDFILAIGGGSAIDSSKAIAIGLSNPQIDVWDFYTKKQTVKSCYPLGVVLTIAASGSEMSNSSVITNEDNWLKKGVNSDFIRPKFAFMNPELTYTLSQYQTAAGVVDIMMHTLERYFANPKGNEMTDRIAEQLLKNTIKYGKICVEAPNDYKARSEIMWSGSLSHNCITGLGTVQNFSVHPIEHELSGMFDVTHGAGLAALWCSWARYVLKYDIDRFAQYAMNVWDCDSTNLQNIANEGINKTEQFFESLKMPINLKQLNINITDSQIDEMANKCCDFGKRSIGSIKSLNIEDVKQIYYMAKS